jgi:hypothetical protein
VIEQPHTAGPAQWSRRKAPRASEALALPFLGRRGRRRSRRRGSAVVPGSGGLRERQNHGRQNDFAVHDFVYWRADRRVGPNFSPPSDSETCGSERTASIGSATAPGPQAQRAAIPQPGPKGRVRYAKTSCGLKVRDGRQSFFVVCDILSEECWSKSHGHCTQNWRGSAGRAWPLSEPEAGRAGSA